MFSAGAFSPKSTTPPGVRLGSAASFGLDEFFGVLNRRILTFLGVWALVALLVIAAMMSQPRMYSGFATLALETTDRARLGDPAQSWVPPTDDSQLVDSEAGVVSSNSVVLRVVEARKLMRNPDYNRALRRPGLMATLFPQAVEKDKARQEQQRLSEVVEEVRKRLEVRRVGRTRLIEISYKARTAQEAADMANAFGDEYIRANLDTKRGVNTDANDWLRGRIGQLRDDVTEAERAVAQYRDEAGLLTTDGATLTERRLTELQQQVSVQRGELADRQAQLAQLQEALQTADDTLPAVLTSETIADLRRQEAEVLRRLGELRQNYGPEWPELRAAEAELLDLRTAIDAEVRRIVSTIERDAQVAAERVRRLEADAVSLERVLASGGVAEVRLKDMQRSAETARTIYETALQRLRLDDLRNSFVEPPARLVSRATPPRDHSEPSLVLSSLVGVVAGLVASAALITLLELLSRGFWSPKTVEDRTGVRNLALIPRIGRGPSSFSLWPSNPARQRAQALSRSWSSRSHLDHALDHPDSALAEAMRSLRAAIGFAQDKASKAVLITSPTVDEGKTFTAIGLARAAAQSGDRVLIIDCDARRRGLSRAFGVKSEAGLIEALQQRFTVSQVLLKDNRTNLHILPLAAFERQDRPELLESPEFRTFTAALAPHYDLIVLDAGPVLLSSAVQVISSWADAVVLSLKWRGTTKGQTEAALDLLARARANLVGCVLTQADVTNPRFFEDGDMGAMLSRYADYFKA